MLFLSHLQVISSTDHIKYWRETFQPIRVWTVFKIRLFSRLDTPTSWCPDHLRKHLKRSAVKWFPRILSRVLIEISWCEPEESPADSMKREVDLCVCGVCVVFRITTATARLCVWRTDQRSSINTTTCCTVWRRRRWGFRRIWSLYLLLHF